MPVITMPKPVITIPKRVITMDRYPQLGTRKTSSLAGCWSVESRPRETLGGGKNGLRVRLGSD